MMFLMLFIAPRSLSEDRGSGLICIPTIEKSVRRNLRIPMYVCEAVYCAVFNDFIIAVLTLCACTPPLDQVLQLWDFLLAFGVHLNVLCVIAQLLLMRDEVMSSSRCVILPLYGSWWISKFTSQPNAPSPNISST